MKKKTNHPPSTNFNQLIATGSNALQAKNYQSAERALKQALDISPTNIPASYLYGISLKYLDKPKKALKYVEIAIKGGIKDAAAHFQYAELLLILNKPERAKQQLKKALAIKTDFLQAAFFLGNIYYEQFQFEQAETYYSKVISLSANHWQALYNISHVYYKQLNYPKALIFLKKCIDIDKKNDLVFAEIASLYEQLNTLDQAQYFSEKALFINVKNIDATVTLVKCLRRNNQWKKGIELLETLDVSEQTAEIQVRFWAEKGKLYEHNSQFPEAHHAFSKVNQQLKIAQQSFPRTDLLKVMARSEQVMKQSIYSRIIHKEKKLKRCSKRVIFIVGFFRSGTTLLEKMLAAHKDISSAGELDALVLIEKQAAKVRLLKLSEHEREKWIFENQHIYYNEAEKRGLTQDNLSLFIDKAPFNIVRLPLIRLLFPNALIIRVIRHPLDIAISCFSEAFGNRYDWSYSLKETIKLITAVDSHYEKVISEDIGIDSMQVKYENLVNDPELIISQILLKLNKNWDSNCLNFHQNNFHTYTASYEQVSKPIYTSSVERYKNFYDFYDQSSFTLLDELLKKQGYLL